MRGELRRGMLVLAVLSALREEQYGYSLRKVLMEAGIDIEEGTLYPLIRRLEAFGLLSSRWTEGEGRRRRYYKISPEGEETRGILLNDWDALGASIAKLTGDDA